MTPITCRRAAAVSIKVLAWVPFLFFLFWNLLQIMCLPSTPPTPNLGLSDFHLHFLPSPRNCAVITMFLDQFGTLSLEFLSSWQDNNKLLETRMSQNSMLLFRFITSNSWFCHQRITVLWQHVYRTSVMSLVKNAFKNKIEHILLFCRTSYFCFWLIYLKENMSTNCVLLLLAVH